MAILNKQQRDQKLDKLQKLLIQYVDEQRERLSTEKAFLKKVLAAQGFSASTRRHTNFAKLGALASAKELLPVFTVESEQGTQ